MAQRNLTQRKNIYVSSRIPGSVSGLKTLTWEGELKDGCTLQFGPMHTEMTLGMVAVYKSIN